MGLDGNGIEISEMEKNILFFDMIDNFTNFLFLLRKKKKRSENYAIEIII